ncbi:FAD-dependent monooxygenase [Pseudoxanthomonas sp. NC8]|nr:FAD-dependent monooxygenase [Pseudoxanthomonas sp. NC8]
MICGAGATGLTLAIELARRGVSFRLLEQREHPFNGSRGKGIQPRSQIFEDMGIVDRLFAAGGPYPRWRTYLADGSSRDTDLADGAASTAAEPYRQPLMVPQFLTEAVLRERLAELGQRVEFGHALTGFEQDADGVTVRIATPEGGQSVRARYLVGADGGRSFVRQRRCASAFRARRWACGRWWRTWCSKGCRARRGTTSTKMTWHAASRCAR